MALPSVLAQFLSFVGGPRLIDGDELNKQAQELFSYEYGITATAGGGQAGAYQLKRRLNRVETCVTNADSVMLPPAIPGKQVIINNATGQSLQVFGVVSNAANGNVGDTIAAANSNAQTATAIGVAQLTTTVMEYFCFKLGEWKQGSMA
jgi:hypothetical protein